MAHLNNNARSLGLSARLGWLVVWLCVYVANLLADNSQELQKFKPRFASSCEYRISSYYYLPVCRTQKTGSFFLLTVCKPITQCSYTQKCGEKRRWQIQVLDDSSQTEYVRAVNFGKWLPILSFAFDFKLLKHFNCVNNKTLAAIKRRIHPKKPKTELGGYAKSYKCTDRRMDSVYRAFGDLKISRFQRTGTGRTLCFSIFFHVFFFFIFGYY